MRAGAISDVSKFEGRRVLITGAAGSVGAALCGRLASARGITLGLLDHADHALLRLADSLPDACVELLLGNVRDSRALTRSVSAFAPDIVIHAAALKHVHLGELHPGECVLTNLIGVRNALAAAHAAGAEDFLLVSSDKAAAPLCLMGACKRLAELYLCGFSAEHASAPRVAAVRFGNVLASQGSVAPLFAEQIERGGPVTLTHPGMQRYFISMDEAVDLVLAVAVRGGAEPLTYVKDMGEPISILRLAEEMIARAGSRAPIMVTGLRPGEKLREQMFDADEAVSPSAIEGVFEARAFGAVSTADVDALEEAAFALGPAALRARVFACLDARLGRQCARLFKDAPAPAA